MESAAAEREARANRKCSPKTIFLLAPVVLVLFALMRSVHQVNFLRRRERAMPSLELWERSWRDVSLLESSPLGFVMPNILRAIEQRQNPPACSDASFVVLNANFHDGLGSMLKLYVVAFHIARQNNRVFLLNMRHKFFWTRGCANPKRDGHLECAFQPLSRTCPFEVVQKLVERNILNAYNATSAQSLSEALEASAPSVIFLSKWNKFRYHTKNFTDYNGLILNHTKYISSHQFRRYLSTVQSSRRVWNISLLYYFLRLNTEMAKYVRSQMVAILKTNNPDYSKLFGIPVRASDKCKHNSLNSKGEMECSSLEEIISVVQRIAFSAPWLTHAILTSEDSEAISERKLSKIKRENEHLRLKFIRNDLDRPPQTGSTNVEVVRKNPFVMLKASLVTVHLQSLCEYHVLVTRSNYHALIYAMAHTTPSKARYAMYPIGKLETMYFSEFSQLW